MAVLVGVISDTHGLLRPRVFDLFAHVDCIIHAGDIGNENILGELEVLAPVHAVYGNTDGFPLVERLPEKQLLQNREPIHLNRVHRYQLREAQSTLFLTKKSLHAFSSRRSTSL